MTTETAIVVVLWLLVLLLSLVLVGYASVVVGSEVDNGEEVEARSVAWKFIWIMVASIVRVVSVTVDVTSVERRVSEYDKVTFVGRANCVVDEARAPFVPLKQVIRGCVVDAITC